MKRLADGDLLWDEADIERNERNHSTRTNWEFWRFIKNGFSAHSGTIQKETDHHLNKQFSCHVLRCPAVLHRVMVGLHYRAYRQTPCYIFGLQISFLEGLTRYLQENDCI